ncbi:unnamed protein product [Phaeothamnion confervicola]
MWSSPRCRHRCRASISAHSGANVMNHETERVQRVRGLGATAATYYKPAVWPPVLEADPLFSVDRHVIAASVDAIADERGLEQYIGELASTRPLQTDRPLWEVLFVEHYGGDLGAGTGASSGTGGGANGGTRSNAGNGGSVSGSGGGGNGINGGSGGRGDSGSLLVVRVHHSMADGLALGSLLRHLVDPDCREAALPAAFHRVGVKRRPGLAQRALLLARLIVFPLVLLVRLLLPADRNRLKAAPSGVKAAAVNRSIPLADLKRVKNGLGVTVNDILMACASAALRAWLVDLAGVEGGAPPRIKAAVPISVRTSIGETTLNNAVGVAHVPLHTDVGGGGGGGSADGGAAARLAATVKTFKWLKTSPEGLGIYWSEILVGMLGRTLYKATASIFACKSTILVSNLPGPDTSVRIAGKRMTSIVFWGCAPGDVCVYLTFMTYDRKVNIGALVDTSVADSAQPLVDGILAEFDVYRKLAAASAASAVAEGESARTAPGNGKKDSGGTMRKGTGVETLAKS